MRTIACFLNKLVAWNTELDCKSSSENYLEWNKLFIDLLATALPFSEWCGWLPFATRCRCGEQLVIDMRELMEPLASVHQLVLFFSNIYSFSFYRLTGGSSRKILWGLPHQPLHHRVHFLCSPKSSSEPPPHQLGNLGERCKLPIDVRGGSPENLDFGAFWTSEITSERSASFWIWGGGQVLMSMSALKLLIGQQEWRPACEMSRSNNA